MFVGKRGQLTGRTGVVLTRLRDSWRISLDINEEFPGIEDVHRAFQNKGHFLYSLMCGGQVGRATSQRRHS